MNYLILERIDLASESWKSFSEWGGLQNVKEYYSIDGITRQSLFNPATADDWKNCVNEDYKIRIITNLEYAARLLSTRFPDGEIIGIIEDPASSKEPVPQKHTLCGYDLLDGYMSVSLLTNWGGKKDGIKNLKLNDKALIDQKDYAYQLRDILRSNFSGDPHAGNCQVWGVYKVNL